MLPPSPVVVSTAELPWVSDWGGITDALRWKPSCDIFTACNCGARPEAIKAATISSMRLITQILQLHFIPFVVLTKACSKKVAYRAEQVSLCHIYYFQQSVTHAFATSVSVSSCDNSLLQCSLIMWKNAANILRMNISRHPSEHPTERVRVDQVSHDNFTVLLHCKCPHTLGMSNDHRLVDVRFWKRLSIMKVNNW